MFGGESLAGSQCSGSQAFHDTIWQLGMAVSSKQHLSLLWVHVVKIRGLEIESNNYPTLVLHHEFQCPLITWCATASFMPLQVALLFLKGLRETARSIA